MLENKREVIAFLRRCPEFEKKLSLLSKKIAVALIGGL